MCPQCLRFCVGLSGFFFPAFVDNYAKTLGAIEVGLKLRDGSSRGRRRDLPCGKKTAPIGAKMSEISRFNEIRLAPPCGKTKTANPEQNNEFCRVVIRGLQIPKVRQPSAFKRRRNRDGRVGSKKPEKPHFCKQHGRVLIVVFVLVFVQIFVKFVKKTNK